MAIQADPGIAAPARLRRTLRLRHLILYGIIMVQPVAAMSIFGVLSQHGHGQAVMAILLAMVAMLFTGISYGLMARVYPSAGSAFTYVAREIHPVLGYITGWSMVLDYVLNPLICSLWCAEQAHNFVPGLPVAVWKLFFAGAFTLLNLQGIRNSARVNAGMAAGMGVVIVIFFVAAAHQIFGVPHPDPHFFTRPFYDPQTFTFSGLFGCTSLAVLTYIGFDGISTLSEEVENPRRNVLLATVLTCVLLGLLAAAQAYAGQLLWPVSRAFPDVDTAFVWVAASAWKPLFGILGVTLLVANFGSGSGAHLGAARLLYGMGRSGALPKSFFGAVDPVHGIPRNNVLAVGAVVLAGSFMVSYDLGAQMLNFGALIGFMGVNVAAFLRYFVRGAQRSVWNFVSPLLGFFICLALWLSLSRPAILAGFVWTLGGLLLGYRMTKGFRRPFSFDEQTESI